MNIVRCDAPNGNTARVYPFVLTAISSAVSISSPSVSTIGSF